MDKFTVSRKVFTNTLKEVRKFMSDDDQLPMLNKVCIKVFEDFITLEATDRFRYLLGAVPIGEDAKVGVRPDYERLKKEPLGVFELRKGDVGDVITALNKVKAVGKNVPLHFSPCDGYLTVSVDSKRLPIFSIDEDDSNDFPDVVRLIPTDYEKGKYTTVEGEKLGGSKALAFHFREPVGDNFHNPQVITQATGNDALCFIGCVMPVRPHADADRLPELINA